MQRLYELSVLWTFWGLPVDAVAVADAALTAFWLLVLVADTGMPLTLPFVFFIVVDVVSFVGRQLRDALLHEALRRPTFGMLHGIWDAGHAFSVVAWLGLAVQHVAGAIGLIAVLLDERSDTFLTRLAVLTLMRQFLLVVLREGARGLAIYRSDEETYVRALLTHQRFVGGPMRSVQVTRAAAAGSWSPTNPYRQFDVQVTEQHVPRPIVLDTSLTL